MVELLKPAAERLITFRFRSAEYDPAARGFENAGGFVPDTTVADNARTGHECGASLSDAGRTALIAGVKTL